MSVRRIAYAINLDKRNEQGIPVVLECGPKGNFSLNPNGVLKIYISLIENGTEQDMIVLTFADPHIGVENTKEQVELEWEKLDKWRKNVKVEM